MPGRAERKATFELRRGVADDADAMVEISTGPIAGKRRFIAESIERRDVVVADSGGRIGGYIVWDRAFFGRPFVWLLGVDPAHRRRGIGRRLLGACEAANRGEGLFVSTNHSNLGMQQLLLRCGYLPSGRVDNLDLNDPELFYFKLC